MGSALGGGGEYLPYSSYAMMTYPCMNGTCIYVGGERCGNLTVCRRRPQDLGSGVRRHWLHSGVSMAKGLTELLRLTLGWHVNGLTISNTVNIQVTDTSSGQLFRVPSRPVPCCLVLTSHRPVPSRLVLSSPYLFSSRLVSSRPLPAPAPAPSPLPLSPRSLSHTVGSSRPDRGTQTTNQAISRIITASSFPLF